MTANPPSAAEWNAWNITQYVMTCSMLSAIIDMRLNVKYRR